jgi:cell division protein FtsN
MTPYSSRRGSGDVVLESRHLIGLFVVMVIIFGVVFVLGYELGRNQYNTQVRASSPETAAASDAAPAVHTALAAKPAAPNAEPSSADAKSGDDSPPPTDWDFYKAADSTPPAPYLEKPAKNAATQPASSPALTAKPANSSVSSPAPTPPPAPNTSASRPGKPNTGSANPQMAKAPSMDAPLIPRGTILLQVAALDRESDALALAEVLEQKKFPTVIVPPGADKFYHVQVGPYHDLESAIAARNALENAGFKSIIKR